MRLFADRIFFVGTATCFKTTHFQGKMEGAIFAWVALISPIATAVHKNCIQNSGLPVWCTSSCTAINIRAEVSKELLHLLETPSYLLIQIGFRPNIKIRMDQTAENAGGKKAMHTTNSVDFFTLETTRSKRSASKRESVTAVRMFVVRSKPIVRNSLTLFRKENSVVFRQSIRWYILVCVFIALSFTTYSCFWYPRRSEYVRTKGLLHGSTLWSDTARFYGTGDNYFEALTGFPPCLAGVTIDGKDANLIGQFEAIRYLRGKDVTLTLLNLDRESQAQVELFFSKNITIVNIDSCDGGWIEKVSTCLPRIREVSIFECRNLDDKDLEHLRLFPNLEKLCVDGSIVRGLSLTELPTTVRELQITNSDCDVDSCIRNVSRFRCIQKLTLQGKGELIHPMLLARNETLQRINLIDVIVTSSDASELRRLLPKASILFH